MCEFHHALAGDALEKIDVQSGPNISASGPPCAPANVLIAWSAAGGKVRSSSHEQALTAACTDTTLDKLANVSASQLNTTLVRGSADGTPISALHLLCHGAERDGVFELTWNGVSPAQLRQLLAPHANDLRLVTLCVGDSSNAGTLGNHLGSLTQALHRIGISWVIGSRYPLSKRASLAFTETFYHHLLAVGASIPVAFRAAQRHLATLDGASREWMSLQLYASLDARARLATAHECRLFLAHHRTDLADAEALAHRLRERDIEP